MNLVHSLYDDYAVTADASRIMKQNKMDMLHDCIRKGNAKKTKAIHIKMPLQEAHTNHTVSLESGFSRSMHSKLRDLIIQHVQMGVTSVPYLRRLLRSYVQKEINDSNIINPCETDRSYFPTTRDIYNSVHAALVTGRYSQFDQENLLQKIEEWKKQNPENVFHFRPSTDEICYRGNLQKVDQIFKSEDSDDEDNDNETSQNNINTFLWVHQTESQQQLLEKYGDMVLIDATYKTTKYALPLFLVVVRTNVGYVPVAEFIIENETSESIKEALEIIKQWNPKWSPKYFMMDYSDQEYQAIHHTFPDTAKYLCYFHVEQSWMRWTRQSIVINKRKIITKNTENTMPTAKRQKKGEQKVITSEKLLPQHPEQVDREEIQKAKKRNHFEDMDVEKQNTTEVKEKAKKVKHVRFLDHEVPEKLLLPENDLLNSDECEIMLQKIWNKKKPCEYILAKVHNINVTSDDILSLSGSTWLTDQVVDAFLAYLTQSYIDQGGNILHIITRTLTNILDGEFNKDGGILTKTKLMKKKTILGAYLQSENHWDLVVIEPWTGDLYFYNPLGETQELSKRICNNWSLFMKARKIKKIEKDQKTWTIKSPQHTKQKDSSNCGVYTLMFAERHLNKKAMVRITPKDVREMRRKIALNLLQFSGYLKNCCRCCAWEFRENQETIQCDQCRCNFHRWNFCVGKENVAKKKFICDACR